MDELSKGALLSINHFGKFLLEMKNFNWIYAMKLVSVWLSKINSFGKVKPYAWAYGLIYHRDHHVQYAGNSDLIKIFVVN